MEISIIAEKLFSIAGFSVTNSLLVAVFVAVLLAISTAFLVRNPKQVPRGAQNVIETVFEGLLSFIESITQDRKQARDFFPLVSTIFLFVLFSNWSGLLPGTGTVGLNEEHAGRIIMVPFLRGPAADLNMTVALSLISVFSVQIFGILALGIRGYASKFLVAPWKKPYVIGTVVGLLELIGEFAKILSFSFRLFGNVFAGEVLLTVMLSLVPYFVPLPFLLLEVFVGVVQAAVFSLLTIVFLKMAVTGHEEGAH
ncbi:MAG: F0F1 ATP synthase subunit A [Candidatus Moranbacteria bacterium]|nr:F0F1 ATP synthase subunit A [Candidatus Moranbacteria bacterium]NTW90201.1 F0F1 ATP synthase subunit A [Candidatus Moranbacteria bacterium]